MISLASCRTNHYIPQTRRRPASSHLITRLTLASDPLPSTSPPAAKPRSHPSFLHAGTQHRSPSVRSVHTRAAPASAWQNKVKHRRSRTAKSPSFPSIYINITSTNGSNDAHYTCLPNTTDIPKHCTSQRQGTSRRRRQHKKKKKRHDGSSTAD